jgi:hypothetical protein
MLSYRDAWEGDILSLHFSRVLFHSEMKGFVAVNVYSLDYEIQKNQDQDHQMNLSDK